MADFMKKILSKPIKLVNQVIKLANEVNFSKEECDQITYQTKELEAIFNLMVAQGRSISYQRPLQRTVAETEKVLNRVISLLHKCRGDGIMKRIFTIIPAAAFQKTFYQLKSSVGDFTQIIRLLEFVEDHDYEHPDHRRDSLDVHQDDDDDYDLRDEHVAYQDHNFLAIWKSAETISENGDSLHPSLIEDYLNVVVDSLEITSSNFQFHYILWAIWPLIGNLSHSSQNCRTFAAKMLLLLSQLNNWYRKLIIEEGGITPLLKLMGKDGIEDQVTVAKVIGTLGYDSESVIRMIDAGVFLKFVEVLKEGPMKIQAEVADKP